MPNRDYPATASSQTSLNVEKSLGLRAKLENLNERLRVVHQRAENTRIALIGSYPQSPESAEVRIGDNNLFHLVDEAFSILGQIEEHQMVISNNI